MFTGIVEDLARVETLQSEEDNLHITLQSALATSLKIDQSVSHNGVCLTVVQTEGETYTVTAVRETLRRSNLSTLQKGSAVNLERCLKLGDRLDGHMVQGHVDQTARCVAIGEENGSKCFTFEYAPQRYTTVEKGSITVNGVSLTVVESRIGRFSIALIPYTYEHTNFHQLREGDSVNLEFDILGKYAVAWLERTAIPMGSQGESQ